MFRKAVFVLVLTSLASGAALAMGPANVIRTDGTCSIGWFGCDFDAGLPLPDGGFTCPGSEIGFVSVQGDLHATFPNNGRGNAMVKCQSTFDFEQPNPGGGLGDADEVVLLPIDTVCTFLPDACQGNGTVIANPRTVGALAVCSVFGATTTRMQEVVTPSGQATLTCHLPDPAATVPTQAAPE